MWCTLGGCVSSVDPIDGLGHRPEYNGRRYKIELELLQQVYKVIYTESGEGVKEDPV